MAIEYNLNKIKDKYFVEVNQDTNLILYYQSDVVQKQSILINSTTKLNIVKDGTYILKLQVENETDIGEVIEVLSFLQNSLAKDIYNIICNNTICVKNNYCISKQDSSILKNKNIFNKLLTYSSLYVSKYGETFFNEFSTYLKNAVLLPKCSFQDIINNIILEECITISDSFNIKLFKSYLFIYWAGFYFTEKATFQSSETEELEYLKEKYFYNEIIKCTCDLCISIEDLEALFNGESIQQNVKIHSFQFDGTEFTTENLNTITDEYLNTNSTLHTENSMLQGKNISFTSVGRGGFAVKTTNESIYDILDLLNNNITTVVFDKVYDSEREILFYLSKEFFTPSTIYYKFQKN